LNQVDNFVEIFIDMVQSSQSGLYLSEIVQRRQKVIRKLVTILLSVAMCLLGVTSALAVKYNEAPMLRTKVAAGELPPVEERLPKVPLVLSPEWNEFPQGNVDLEIGQYGGTMRMADMRVDCNPDTFWNEPPLITPGINVTEGAAAGKLRGNVFQGAEISEDKKVFTFHMREGLKWSDGMPVTTEDVLFKYEDILMNEELTAVFPKEFTAGGEPMKLEIIDDYTFRIRFAEPYPLFLYFLGTRWVNYDILMAPKHYMSQFHIRYTPLEQLKPLLEKGGFGEEEWWNLFWKMYKSYSASQYEETIDFPTLWPWRFVGEPAAGIYLFERNPYYFKVDAAGNQLPYIDKVKNTWVAEREMAVMKAVAGEIDYQSARSGPMDYPLFKENEEKGDYRVVNLPQHVTPYDVYLNLTYPDPVWREVVRDVRFRKALDMGINREEINEIVQCGLGNLPSKVKTYPYDPAKANQLLDEMGLDKRDAEGWRLGPDGKRFVIPFEFSRVQRGQEKVVELVTEYWKSLGIMTTMKIIDLALYWDRKSANDLKAFSEWNALNYWECTPLAWFLAPSFILGDCGPLWGQWWSTDGEKGEEPPLEVKKYLELYKKITMSESAEEVKKRIDETRQLISDNAFWFTLVESVYPTIFNKNLGNTPSRGYGIESNSGAELYFFRQ